MHPGHFARDRHDPIALRARVQKYPYTLIFMVHHDMVVLLALAHGRRKPGYWKKRLRLVTDK